MGMKTLGYLPQNKKQNFNSKYNYNMNKIKDRHYTIEDDEYANDIFFDGNEIKYFFNEKYRINSMNIFQEGIKPLWEDDKNNGGKYFQLDYQIKKDDIQDFANLANVHWKKLALCVMGGSLPYADYINGIRFVDKTDFDRGKIIMFRMEVWIRKGLEQNKLDELLKSLFKRRMNVYALSTKT